MQYWTITNTAGTLVLAAAFPTPSVGSHPKDNGWAWEAATQKATRIDKVPDLAAQVWSGTAWVENTAQIETQVLLELKAEAERRKMAALSTGGAKKIEYDDKMREIIASATIVSSVLNALSAATAKVQYPNAAIEQALTGEPLATILTRYRAGADASMPEVRRLSAIEQNAARLIKAATTGAAKRAAYAAVNWSWKP